MKYLCVVCWVILIATYIPPLERGPTVESRLRRLETGQKELDQRVIKIEKSLNGFDKRLKQLEKRKP